MGKRVSLILKDADEAVILAMRDYVEQFRRIEALARSREQAKG